MELANLLQRDRQSVTDALEELCRCKVCIRHPDAASRIAFDRLSWRSATASGLMRSRRWRSMASTRTAMSSRSGRCWCALLACGSTSAPPTNDWRRFSIARGTLLHLQGHLARLRPQVCGAVERERTRSHACHQPELLLRPVEEVADTSGGKTTGSTRRKSDPTEGCGWVKLRPGVIPAKRRNEGNEIMLILPRNIQALACCAGACLQSIFLHLGKLSTAKVGNFQTGGNGEYSTGVDTACERAAKRGR